MDLTKTKEFEGCSLGWTGRVRKSGGLVWNSRMAGASSITKARDSDNDDYLLLSLHLLVG